MPKNYVFHQELLRRNIFGLEQSFFLGQGYVLLQTGLLTFPLVSFVASPISLDMIAGHPF